MHNQFQSDAYKYNVKKGLGCLFIPFSFIADNLGGWFLKNEAEKREIDKFAKEAEDLSADRQIKTLICEALQKASRKEIITEEKFVKIVTENLLGLIPLEPVLFASVAFKISETGIEKFCDEINDEK
ncbi:MAG TPA: hypothetical protein VK892_04320 [Pyrinomonadaceae bacterium]|nr:hypothetical protein [Pyrinomonadaceae bacterium]